MSKKTKPYDPDQHITVVKETDPQKYWKVDAGKAFHSFAVYRLNDDGNWASCYSSDNLEACRSFAKAKTAALPEYY